MITKMAEGSGTIVRRNLPGTKSCNYSKWPEESFDEMDSTLAVQQYIQQTIRKAPQGKNSSLFLPLELITSYFQTWTSSLAPPRPRMRACGSTSIWGSSAWNSTGWRWSCRASASPRSAPRWPPPSSGSSSAPPTRRPRSVPPSTTPGEAFLFVVSQQKKCNPGLYIAKCDSVLIVTLASDTLLMARLVSWTAINTSRAGWASRRAAWPS